MRKPSSFHEDGDEYQPLPPMVRERRPADTRPADTRPSNIPRHRRKDRRWLAVLILVVAISCLATSAIAAVTVA